MSVQKTENYNFGGMNIDAIIRTAYERIGIPGSLMTGQHITSAKNSLNLIFSEWANDLKLWMVSQNMFSIIPGQADYSLPLNIVNIIDGEIKVANCIRQLGGTAFAFAGNPSVPNGNAANAFNPSSGGACTQTVANGYIGYDFGALTSYPIKYIGVQSNIATNYTLMFEYSLDANSYANNVWLNPFDYNALPNSGIYYPTTQSFQEGQITWFVMPNAASARYWRVRETSGAVLNIQQLYFDLPTHDSHLISRFQRSEYLSVPNVQVVGSVSTFEVNLTLPPTLSLYPTPNSTYAYVIYNAKTYIKDVNSMLDNYFVPQQWLPSIVARLAFMQAMAFAPDRTADTKAYSDEVYMAASYNNCENGPTRIFPDFVGGYGY